MSRLDAVNKALDLRPLGDDGDAWFAWVRETDELNDLERRLVLTTTDDEFEAFAAAGERIAAIDAVLELGARWSVPGGTVGEAVERCRREGTPEEYAQFVELNEAIAPGGILTVAVER